MSDDSNINYSVAEKFSYAYVDGKYAKIAVSADGSAVLADPLTWSYAETHSYVKVDPDSLGVEVPSGVTEIYAKVIYIPGIGGGSSGGSSSIDENKINSKINSLSSAIDANSSEIEQLSITVQNISIPTKLSDLPNDQQFATSSYVDGKFDAISVPSALSQLNDDIGLATSSYVDEKIVSVKSTIPSLSGYATESYVDEQILAIPSPQPIPSAVSYFENDVNYTTSGFVISYYDTKANELVEITLPNKINEIVEGYGYATSAEMNTVISGLCSQEYVDEKIDIVSSAIPNKNSELENDSQFVPLSTVQSMLQQIASSFNLRIAKLESTIPSGTTDLGERADSLNVLDFGDRADGSAAIEYLARNTSYSEQSESQEMTVQQLAEMYNQRLAALEAKLENAEVVMGLHSDDIDNLIVSDRQETDDQSNGIIFNNRI